MEKQEIIELIVASERDAYMKLCESEKIFGMDSWFADTDRAKWSALYALLNEIIGK